MRAPHVLLLAALPFAWSFAACTGPVREFSESKGGGGSAGTAGGSEGGGGPVSPCEEDGTHVCVPETPLGWSGPFARYEGPIDDATPACAGDYPTPIGEFKEGFVPGEAECKCTCEPAHGIVCTGSAAVCFTGTCAVPCAGGSTFVSQAPCPNDSLVGSTTKEMVVTPPSPDDAGSCTPRTAHTLPTPKFVKAVKTCGGAEPEAKGCEGGESCVPRATAPFVDLCIAHAGDVACPDDFFETKVLLHEDFEDSRKCSECDCDDADSSCKGSIQFVIDTCDLLEATVAVPSCGAQDADIPGSASATYTPNPEGTCPPLGGELTGKAVPTGAVTTCCH